MHPLLSDWRRRLIYAMGALPLAAVIVSTLARGPDAAPLASAVGLALPLALVAVLLLLPVFHLCRVLPVGGTPLTQLLAVHALCALLVGGGWVYVGAALARLVATYAGDPTLPLAYARERGALLTGGALLYLLAAAFSYMLGALGSARRAEKQAVELAMLAREAELRALKAQVHPHFLFNSLNSISALTASDPMRAREMCVLLAEFFRRSLALGEKQSVTLDEELAVASAYLAIESMRLGARLSVVEEIDEAARAARLPPLLLQPLVENAVRHGVATCAEGGVLRLEAHSNGRDLRLLVENPFDPEAPPRPGVGLGLENVRRRLLARYGEAALLDAQRSPGLFRVTLLLPAEGEA